MDVKITSLNLRWKFFGEIGFCITVVTAIKKNKKDNNMNR